MRQNTAVLGITCFIEASSVALRQSEKENVGVKAKNNKKKMTVKMWRIGKREGCSKMTGLQLSCSYIA